MPVCAVHTHGRRSFVRSVNLLFFPPRTPFAEDYHGPVVGGAAGRQCRSPFFPTQHENRLTCVCCCFFFSAGDVDPSHLLCVGSLSDFYFKSWPTFFFDVVVVQVGHHQFRIVACLLFFVCSVLGNIIAFNIVNNIHTHRKQVTEKNK